MASSSLCSGKGNVDGYTGSELKVIAATENKVWEKIGEKLVNVQKRWQKGKNEGKRMKTVAKA